MLKICKLILIYVAIACFLIFLASRMGLPFYKGIDEELYLNMAKSFWQNFSFSRDGVLVFYSCVLYSICLSIAYWMPFSNVWFVMRVLNVLIMCTAIFPSYLLADKILKNSRIALIIGALSILIPDMLYTSYFFQENLAYPLCVWTFYMIYCVFQETESVSWPKLILLNILFAALFFSKSYLIVIPAAFYGCIVVMYILRLENRNIKIWLKSILLFIAFILFFEFVIKACNGFAEGYDHYSSQIMRIFPIDLRFVMDWLRGVAYYVFWVMLLMGIFPILIPFCNIEKYKKTDVKFILFLLTALVLTICEIVTIVYMPENRNDDVLRAVHFRYFFIFFVPLFVMTLKLPVKKFYLNKRVIFTCLFFIFYATLFLRMQNHMGSRSLVAGITAWPLSLAGDANGKFNLFFLLLIVLYVVIGIIILAYTRFNIKRMGIGLCAVILFAFWSSCADMAEIPLNTEYLAEDFKTIGKMLQKNTDVPVIVISSRRTDNLNFLNLYLRNDVRYIDLDGQNLDEQPYVIENLKEAYVVIAKDRTFDLYSDDLTDVLQLSDIEVYVTTKNIDVWNTNLWNLEDSLYVINGKNLKEGFQLNQGGYAYGPYMKVKRGTYEITIEGSNLDSFLLEPTADEITIMNKTDSFVNLKIEIEEDLENFELYMRNDSSNLAKINSIIITNYMIH